MTIRLVVGLGNPGREHALTRHNAGFWFADALAARLATAFTSEGRFHGAVAHAASDLRLLKPGTYMNLSGRSVSALMRFFAAPDQMLVVHDELTSFQAKRG
jgi:PTH1 family peptidyl-tRNA hydrolase